MENKDRNNLLANKYEDYEERLKVFGNYEMNVFTYSPIDIYFFAISDYLCLPLL